MVTLMLVTYFLAYQIATFLKLYKKKAISPSLFSFCEGSKRLGGGVVLRYGFMRVWPFGKRPGMSSSLTAINLNR